jgi:hydrogenase nickel incorporation protein HypB
VRINGWYCCRSQRARTSRSSIRQFFNSADVAIVTKSDLTATVELDWDSGYRNIQGVRPGMRVFHLSAKTGAGLEEYLGFLA